VSYLALAFALALSRTGESRESAAVWCGVSRRTVYRWLAGELTPNVERIMRSRRLWAHFWFQLGVLTGVISKEGLLSEELFP
jgi:hypothetical protein